MTFSLFRIIAPRIVEDTTFKPQLISTIRWQPDFVIILMMTTISVRFQAMVLDEGKSGIYIVATTEERDVGMSRLTPH